MENQDSKKEILKDLLITEEDTVKKLRGLVETSKNFFGIEGNTGKIIFHKHNLTNRQRILCLLIGKYFAKELEIIEKNSISLKEMAQQLDIQITTLSGPMGELVKKGLVKKEDGEYKIQYYKIDSILSGLNDKEGEKLTTKKSNSKKRSSRPKVIKTEQKELIPNKEGLKLLAEKSGITDEQKLYNIFDFDTKIHLLHTPRGSNEGEKQLKATLLILTAYNHYYNEREIPSSDLINILQDIGISSLVNLSTNLKEHKNLIIHKKGKKGNTNTHYRITIPGLQRGYSLIKECLNNGN